MENSNAFDCPIMNTEIDEGLCIEITSVVSDELNANAVPELRENNIVVNNFVVKTCFECKHNS